MQVNVVNSPGIRTRLSELATWYIRLSTKKPNGISLSFVRLWVISDTRGVLSLWYQRLTLFLFRNKDCLVSDASLCLEHILNFNPNGVLAASDCIYLQAYLNWTWHNARLKVGVLHIHDTKDKDCSSPHGIWGCLKHQRLIHYLSRVRSTPLPLMFEDPRLNQNGFCLSQLK